MDMIERVARAIAGVNGIGLDEANEAMWRVHEMEARAVIEAMREPTEAMLEAYDNTVQIDFEGEPLNLPQAYTAMIDAALGPQATEGE